MDPVAISNQLANMHPVEFLGTYRDIVYGFEGVATNVTYLAHGGIRVLLTKKGDTPESNFFAIELIEPVNGAKFSPDVDPEHPVEFLDVYKDDITEFVGKVTHISYSVSKCVQVNLARANEGKLGDWMTDIQNLVPVGASKPHNLTSDITPGSTLTALPQL